MTYVTLLCSTSFVSHRGFINNVFTSVKTGVQTLLRGPYRPYRIINVNSSTNYHNFTEDRSRKYIPYIHCDINTYRPSFDEFL